MNVESVMCVCVCMYIWSPLSSYALLLKIHYTVFSRAKYPIVVALESTAPRFYLHSAVQILVFCTTHGTGITISFLLKSDAIRNLLRGGDSCVDEVKRKGETQPIATKFYVCTHTHTARGLTGAVDGTQSKQTPYVVCNMGFFPTRIQLFFPGGAMFLFLFLFFLLFILLFDSFSVFYGFSVANRNWEDFFVCAMWRVCVCLFAGLFSISNAGHLCGETSLTQHERRTQSKNTTCNERM